VELPVDRLVPAFAEAGRIGFRNDTNGAIIVQGMSIINFIADERKQAMLDFITWFATEENQAKWAALGGYTCNINVLSTDTFLKAQPYNPAFAETMTFVKDFWNIPIFNELLVITQTNFSKFIIEGEGTAKETMDTIAVEQDKVLKENGYIKAQ
jgi:multiple sugar transport system substrate-binding protein